MLFYCPVYGLYTSQGVADFRGDLIGMTGTVPPHVAHAITWEEHGYAHLISRSEEIAAEVAGTVPRLHCWVVVVGALWLQFFLFTMIYIDILYIIYWLWFLKGQVINVTSKNHPPNIGQYLGTCSSWWSWNGKSMWIWGLESTSCRKHLDFGGDSPVWRLSCHGVPFLDKNEQTHIKA